MISPPDELIFFRGVGIPPTSYNIQVFSLKTLEISRVYPLKRFVRWVIKYLSQRLVMPAGSRFGSYRSQGTELQQISCAVVMFGALQFETKIIKPIGSMYAIYMVTCTIHIPQMLAYIPAPCILWERLYYPNLSQCLSILWKISLIFCVFWHWNFHWIPHSTGLQPVSLLRYVRSSGKYLSAWSWYEGFHRHGGTQKWMIYTGKSFLSGWFGVTYPILGNLHVSKDGVYHQLWHVMAISIEDTMW